MSNVNYRPVRTWLAIIFFILGMLFLYEAWHAMMPFIISAVLVYLLEPVVTWMTGQKVFGQKLSRGMGVIFVYLFFFSTMTLLGFLLVPRLQAEVLRISHELPNYVTTFRNEQLPSFVHSLQGQADRLGVAVNVKQTVDESIGTFLKSGQGAAGAIAHNLQGLIGGLFHLLITSVLVFIVTAFVLLDMPNLKRGARQLIPAPYRDDAREIVIAINRDVSGAIRGQLLICLVNGILTTIGLMILGVKYSVTIGIIAGICSLIPIFGTIISTIPAVLIAITQSWVVAVQVLGVIALIHLIEANFLNPKIMGHQVELHPAVILFALVMGEHLFGMAGLLMAVPLAAILRSVIRFLYLKFFLEEDLDIPPVDILPGMNAEDSC